MPFLFDLNIFFFPSALVQRRLKARVILYQAAAAIFAMLY